MGDLRQRAPRISVCVPLYNHRQYIEQLLDSVAADGYPDKELIVIDDGSRDGSFELLDRWRARAQPAFPCVFERQENVGVAETLNRLLRRATGAYCAIVASDDVLAPGGLKARAEYLEAHPEHEAVFADARVIDSEGNVLVQSGLSDLYHADKRRYRGRSLLYEIVVRWSVPGPVLMVRREEMLGRGGFSPGYLEDYDAYVRLADAGRLGFIDAVVADYRLHSTNVSKAGASTVRIRRALIKTCWKNIRSVRARTAALLGVRLAMSCVQDVVKWGRSTGGVQLGG